MNDKQLQICNKDTHEINYILNSFDQGNVYTIKELDRIYFKYVATHQHSLYLELTDIVLEPTRVITEHNKTLYQWENANAPFFVNLVGEISVRILIEDGNQKIVPLDFGCIEIIPSKITYDDLIQMINFISEGVKLQGNQLLLNTSKAAAQFMYLDHLFPQDELVAKLKTCNDGIETLKAHMPHILANPISKLCTEYKISDIENRHEVDIDWAMENLYSFAQGLSTDQNYFTYNGQIYTQVLYRNRLLTLDYNIYENIIIYNYINSLISFIMLIRDKFKNMQLKVDSGSNVKSLFQIVRDEENKFYVQTITLLLTSLPYLEMLKKTLENKYQLSKNNIPLSLKFTAKAKANFYYRGVFEKIFLWHKHSETVNTEGNRKQGIKTLDRLYEAFCWYKLFFAILECGFTISSEADVSDEMFSVNFAKENIMLTFAYEYSFEFKGEKYKNIENWNTSGNSIVYRKSKRSPDFTMMITNKTTGLQSLAIFDAKYVPEKKAFKESLPECTMKYVHGLATIDGKKSPVKSMYILYNGSLTEQEQSRSELHFVFDEFNIYSTKPILPALGCAKFSVRSKLDYTKFVNAIIELS